MKHGVFNDDSFAKLHAADKLVVIPDFVKEGTASFDQNLDKTASDQFADPAERTYPLNDKSNTWLSRMYFELFDKEAMDSGKAHIVGRRINEAAEFWGIPEMEKRAEKPFHVHEIPLTVGEEVIHTVKVASSSDMEKAASELLDGKGSLSYSVRKQYARGLLKAPEDFKTSLDGDTLEKLEKTAGFGMTTRPRAGQAILDRVCLLGSYPEYSEKLTELGKSLPDTMSINVLDKIASSLDLVDRCCEFTRYYGKGLNPPEMDLFEVTEKQAMEMKAEVVPLTNGNIVHRTAIEKDAFVIDAFFKQYFGKIPYDGMEEKIAMIESLPSDDADALQKITGLK